MTTKKRLLQHIDELVNGIPEDKQIQIFYENPITGEVTELEVYSDRSNLTVIVDSPATAETFKKLRNHDKKAGSQE